jgi:CHAT domain-containing protein
VFCNPATPSPLSSGSKTHRLSDPISELVPAVDQESHRAFYPSNESTKRLRSIPPRKTSKKMDYQKLSNVLGGSIFQDDYRGNFADIANAIDAERLVVENLTQQEQSEIMLLEVFFCLASGNYAKAQRNMKDLLLKASHLDRAFVLRCRTYQFRLLSLQCEPPVLRFCGTIGNTAAMLITEPLDMWQQLRDLEDVRSSMSLSLPDTSAVMENRLFGTLHKFNTDVNLAALHHPHHASNHNTTLAERITSSPIHTLNELSAESKTFSLSAYFQRLIIEWHLASHDAQSLGMVARLRQDCIASKDNHGAAMTWIIEGDSHCSEPFTSPMALNLIAKTRGTGWHEEDWDLCEFPKFLERTERAEMCYVEALKLMKSACSPRGQGLVLLRLGCMYHAEAIVLPEENVDWLGNLQKADESFENARQLFYGDVTHLRILECHQLLAEVTRFSSRKPVPGNGKHRVSREEREDIVTRAITLGKSTREQGDARLAQFLGTLTLRLGRKSFVEFRNSTMASLCCDCAGAIFQAAGDSFMWTQALIAHAELLEQLSDFDRALLKVTDARAQPEGPLLLALTQIRSLVNPQDPESTFVYTYQNALSSFDQIAQRIYVATARTDLADSWHDLRVRLERELPFPQSTPLATEGLLSMQKELPGYPATTNITTAKTALSQPLQEAKTAETEFSPKLDVRALTDLARQKMSDLRNLYRAATAPAHTNERRVSEVQSVAQPTAFTSLDQLVRAFNLATANAYTHLDEAHVDSWSETWRRFIESCDETLVAEYLAADQVSLYKLIACSNFGDLRTAQTVLVQALPYEFRENGEKSFLDQVRGHAHEFGLGGQQQKWKDQAAERALSLCVLAQDWEKGQEVLEKASKQSPRYGSPESLSRDPRAWQEASFVGQVHEHNAQHHNALLWYLDALQRLEGLRNSADVDARHEAHSTIHSNELYSGLMRICQQKHNAQHSGRTTPAPATLGLGCPTWKDQAVFYLEKGRARALLDLLVTKGGIDANKLRQWTKELYRRRLDVLLRSLEIPGADERHAMSAKNCQDRLHALEGDDGNSGVAIAASPSELGPEQTFAVSMDETTHICSDTSLLYKLIPNDTLVLETFANRQETGIICITSEGVRDVQSRPDLNDISLRNLVLRWVERIHDLVGARPECPLTTLETMKTRAMASAKEVSDAVLSKCQGLIDKYDNIVIVPSHSLQRFPCSAYVQEQQPLFLRKVIYQIPSLSVLSQISNDNEAISCEAGIAVLASNKAISVDPKIPLSVAAMISVSRVMGTQPRDMDELSVAELRSIFESHDVVFASTHGSNVFDLASSPWQSYLEGNDGRLRVVDLASLSRCASLVIFSACWGGLGSTTVGSDVLGFSHAVLASGTKAFIGALWQLDSLVALFLTTLFAHELVSPKPGSTVATAWNTALRKMYRLDKEECVGLLKDLLQQYDATPQNERMSFKDFSGIRSRITRAIKDESSWPIDLTRPDYWAAYNLVGQGGFPVQRLNLGEKR